MEWTGQTLAFIPRTRNATLTGIVFTNGSSLAWQQQRSQAGENRPRLASSEDLASLYLITQMGRLLCSFPVGEQHEDEDFHSRLSYCLYVPAATMNQWDHSKSIPTRLLLVEIWPSKSCAACAASLTSCPTGKGWGGPIPDPWNNQFPLLSVHITKRSNLLALWVVPRDCQQKVWNELGGSRGYGDCFPTLNPTWEWVPVFLYHLKPAHIFTAQTTCSCSHPLLVGSCLTIASYICILYLWIINPTSIKLTQR